MSESCVNTTPLASGVEGILGPRSAIFDGLLDISTIATNNPLIGFDRAKLIDVTSETNRILALIDLSQWPVLKSRFEQGPLTFVEIADFILQNQYDIDALITTLKNFPVTTGGTGTNTGGGTGGGANTGGTDGGVGTNTGGTDGGGGAADGGGDTADGGGGGGATPPATPPVPTAPVTDWVDDLDYYYDKNLGESIAGGVCGAFNDIFLQLGALFTLLQQGLGLAAYILQLYRDYDPVQLAKSLSFQAIIEAIKIKVLEIIDKVIEQLLKQLEAIATAAIDIYTGIEGAGQWAWGKLITMVQDVKDSFSEENTKTLKERVEAFMDYIVEQFERLTVENIALMLFRFCLLTEVIQGLLSGPVDGLKAIAISLTAEYAVLKSFGLGETQKAVALGAIRVGHLERKATKESAAASINSQQPSIAEVAGGAQCDWVTPCTLTPDEVKIVTNTDEGGAPGKFTFAGDVVSQNQFEAMELEGAGWKKIDKVVLGKLARVSEYTGQQYVITSGYRSPAYNKSVGGVTNSLHTTGKAIDVRMPGNKDEFIVAASRAGFTGIGVYNSFIHLDIGPRRSWLKGSSNNQAMRELVGRHNQDALRTKA
jgi:hypothetical protein